MIPEAWRRREVAVIGLARSGAAATRWLAGQGVRVYASDVSGSEEIRVAAQELSGPLVVAESGRHDLDRIGRAAVAIVSPGVPPDAPPIAAARKAGVEVLAELDLAFRALTAVRFVVITGTNGKTTTTALIAHIMREAGVRAEAAGNIGRPLIDVASEPTPPEWAVVEASSFQLHDAPHLSPAIGVLTNLAPNHLDRYPTLDAYYADKRLLFRNATESSIWVLNGDDGEVERLSKGVPGKRRYWSLAGPRDAWLDRAESTLMLDGAKLLPRDRLPLLGDHNAANALAAALATRAAGVDAKKIAAALMTFRALAHRLEPIREMEGVLWINDSKATSVAAAAVGLAAMDRPFIWIAGGRHKGEPYVSLVPLLSAHCRGIVVLGEAAELIAHDLSTASDLERARDLPEAVARARARARPGDAVLLSPACSSYDMFTDYEQRGATFRRLVEAL